MSKDSVLGLFRQHADTHPERPALVDRERSFSYRELDRLSDRLAAHLARRGVARGERLPLLAERSAELVIAILAAAKCAAAYVPVDRRQPDRRKQEILRQCQAPVALATQAEDLPGQPVEVIAQVLATSAAGAAPRPALDGSEALYVIFTSGTTGEPKGVVIESRSLSNLVDWHNRRFEMDQRSRTTLMAGVGFDVCQWEIWSTLCAGACLHLVPDEVRPDPAALLAFFAEQRISHAFAPTVMVPALVEQPAPPSLALRYLFCAGKTAAGRNRRAALYRGGLLRPDRSHGLRHLPHRRRRSSSAARLDRHAHRRLRGIHSRRRRPALPWRPARQAEPGGRLPGARIPARPGHDRQALPLLAGTAAPALSHRRQGPLAGRRQPAVPRSAGRPGEDPRPPRRTRRHRSRAAAPAGDPWRGGAGACRPTLR